MYLGGVTHNSVEWSRILLSVAKTFLNTAPPQATAVTNHETQVNLSAEEAGWICGLMGANVSEKLWCVPVMKGLFGHF